MGFKVATETPVKEVTTIVQCVDDSGLGWAGVVDMESGILAIFQRYFWGITRGLADKCRGWETKWSQSLTSQ